IIGPMTPKSLPQHLRNRHEDQLSSITSNKLCLFPIISASRKDSDIENQILTHYDPWNPTYQLNKERIEKLLKKSKILGMI
ncbi:hypothetical protein, partial [Sphingobacterium multivorum]|uniref:hypothetical protein n=1 Tax=Sphingobacterium multivorum TaxID=28454 RepID=UPI0028AD0DB6